MTDEAPPFVEVVTDPARLDSLKPAWEELYNANPKQEIFLSYTWAAAVCDSFREVKKPFIIFIWSAGKVVGILPLAKEGGKLTFIGTPHADYNDMLCRQGFESAVAEQSLKAIFSDSTWQECELDNLLSSSDLLTWYQRSNSKYKSQLSFKSSIECPTLILESSKQEIIDNITSKQSFQRALSKIKKEGKVVFRHLEIPAEIQVHLEILFRQHIARRALAGDKSIFQKEEVKEFYKTLCQRFDPRSELRFSVLEVDQIPVAYHLGFQTAEKFIWYKPIFDIDWWDYSPGEVLLYHLFKYVLASNVVEFDFTVGDEEFKDRFTNRVRTNTTLALHRTAAKARVSTLLNSLKQTLKSVPQVAHLRARLKSAFAAYKSNPLFQRQQRTLFAVFKAGSGAEFHASAAKLSELALLNSKVIHEWRKRIKSGENCFFIYDKENVLLGTIWRKVSSAFSAFADNRDLTPISLTSEAVIFYDYQHLSIFRGEDFLGKLIECLPDARWICIDQAIDEIRRCGGVPECTIKRWRAFYFLQNTRVINLKINDETIKRTIAAASAAR
jgi:CelD/BcsL family acetyltransferase involved in cellulose biosynthesis